MGLFSFLFPFKSSSPSISSTNDPIKDTHKDDTYLLKNNNVITIKDDDEFINVDLRKLSYAEAAALSNIQSQNESIPAAAVTSSVDVLSDINRSATTPTGSNVLDINGSTISGDDSIPVIDASIDASSHNLTDYQLAEIIQSQLLSNKNDQIEQFAEDFEKSYSISKHSKLNKKNKKKKKNTKKSKMTV